MMTQQIETIPIDQLTKDPKNRRRHTKRDITATRESLKEFGQVTPIVVDHKNKVVKGNGTLEAAIQLGWTEIDIVRTKLKGRKQRRYAIADNRTGELAGWHVEDLIEDFKQPNFTVPGFSDGDVARMVRKAGEANGGQPPAQQIHVTITCPKCDFQWDK